MPFLIHTSVLKEMLLKLLSIIFKISKFITYLWLTSYIFFKYKSSTVLNYKLIYSTHNYIDDIILKLDKRNTLSEKY